MFFAIVRDWDIDMRESCLTGDTIIDMTAALIARFEQL